MKFCEIWVPIVVKNQWLPNGFTTQVASGSYPYHYNRTGSYEGAQNNDSEWILHDWPNASGSFVYIHEDGYQGTGSLRIHKKIVGKGEGVHTRHIKDGNGDNLNGKVGFSPMSTTDESITEEEAQATIGVVNNSYYIPQEYGFVFTGSMFRPEKKAYKLSFYAKANQEMWLNANRLLYASESLVDSMCGAAGIDLAGNAQLS